MRVRWIAVWVVMALALLVGTVVSLNYAFVNGPVSKALADDPRNAGLEIFGHYSGWLNPKVLVLDLRRVERPTPANLFRPLLQIAAVMSDRRLERVVLARSGQQVYYIEGEAFKELGVGQQSGEDLVYLARKVPGTLRQLDGSRAFRRWEGSSDFVVRAQMEELYQAARRWAFPGQ